MKTLKKLAAIVIAASMTLGMLTVTAFAADGYTEVATATALKSAFGSGKTSKVRLTADITMTAQITASANENVTIDLNGHKITTVSGDRFYYSSKTSSVLTIEDSVSGGDPFAETMGQMVRAGTGCAKNGGMFYTSGTLNIKGGAFSGGETSAKGTYIYATGTSAVVNISGGKFADPVSDNACIYAYTGSTLNLTGGLIGQGDDNSFWAYGSGTQVNITGDVYLQGTSVPKSASLYGSVTAGYSAATLAPYIADTDTYGEITLSSPVHGCTYRVIDKTNRAEFTSVSATILEGVRFNVKANVTISDQYAGQTPVMKAVIDGQEVSVNGVSEGDGVYAFSFENAIPIIDIDEDIDPKIYIGDELISEEMELSVHSYFNLIRETNSDQESLNAFLASTLKLADKLQVYANGSSTVQHDSWEETSTVTATPQDSDNVRKVSVQAASTDNKIVSAGLNIYDKICLYFRVNATKDSTLTITLDGEGVYAETFASDVTGKVIYLDRISPKSYDGLYVATLSDANGTLSEIEYSINSYCKVKENDATVGELATAIFQYGYAADAYSEDGGAIYLPAVYTWSNDYSTCTAERTTEDGATTQSETVTAVKTLVEEGSGVVADTNKMVADFENPAFATQEHSIAPDAKAANTEGSKTQTAYEKHLILNDDGSYGGSYDADTYGEGAPKNGELDNVESGYYATNDYYNTKCTDTRTILTGFASYQQTMADTDGIASVLMALNYCGESYTEKALLDKYEELNSTTVYGNGTTAAGLKALVENYGFTADASTTAASSSKFVTLVKNTLSAGKIMLIRFQQAEKARWGVVIGYDSMGNTKLNSDPIIMAVPFDAYDQYQDGYQVYAEPILYSWWREQTSTGTQASHEILIITPKEEIELQTSSEDNIKTYPFSAEKHLLLNTDGTYGGELNPTLYGDEGTALNGTYINSSGHYEYNEMPEYNYFGKADFYNMQDSESRQICSNFSVFQQTMASSCGICSTLNTLNYLGYDFTKLDNYVDVETYASQCAYAKGEIVSGGNYDKVQEALVNIYMQGDSNFNTHTTLFNNYGSVGAAKLAKIGTKLGYTCEGKNYSVKSGSSMIFSTFADFKTYIQERLGDDLPLIISWCPGTGHWETIIGYDDMGTESTYDDVVVLADSADSHDQYQDGYNTIPAMQFYAQWFNGTASLGQAQVRY